MHIDLTGQVILVTGGSRGIGKAIVRTLCEAGASVGLHYGRNEQAASELAQNWPSRCEPIQADLSNPEAVAHLIPAVVKRFGRIDALVNNAGVATETDPTDRKAWQTKWEQMLQVNLIAAARLTQDCLPLMAAQGGGRLVHIASRAAFRGDTPDYMAYAASKGGLVAFSRSVARGYGKQGIKSFVIAPGFVQTDMAQPFIDRYGEDYVKNDLALNQLTQPGDIAPTVLFLLSGHMDHATGTSIDINAGSYVH